MLFFVTKKKHLELLKEAEKNTQRISEELNNLKKDHSLVKEELDKCTILVNNYFEKYPFELGQVVYDVQLRNSKGKYTKHNASREYSLVNEVVVDKKNYFNLVDRYHNKDVFVKAEDANAHLMSVCVD